MNSLALQLDIGQEPMFLQPEFYLHIVSGRAGDAAPLLARMALHMGYDAIAYPVSLSELKKVNDFARAHGTCGLNEFFVGEYIRSSMMEGVTPWRADQVERLKIFASSPLSSTITEKITEKQTPLYS